MTPDDRERDATPATTAGGLVHVYQRYDPQRFPPPDRPGGDDVASAALEHMLHWGDRRPLTEEELRNAVRLDPSEIAGLGPSLEALIRLLEERRRKILETWAPATAQREAERRCAEAARTLDPPDALRERVLPALRRGRIPELERLWYRAEREDPPFAGRLLAAIARIGERYEVDELATRWAFTGRRPLAVDEAIDVKQQLETIERLLEQLREAMKDARIGIVDLDALREFVEDADVAALQELGERIADHLRRQAEAQGLERDAEGRYRATPKTHRIFQGRILDEIFSELEAGRSGRHAGPVVGEGVVELPSTRPYAFGDAISHVDLPQTLLNAALRDGAGGGRRPRIRPEDIEVHPTRHAPKCATCLLVDMSGSMAQMGQYVQTKRMALAMDGLIRSEYPGDMLRTVEIATFARTVPPGELLGLMPKPVTTRSPVVRLRVDMSDPNVTESMVHPHFTNIQHGLSLARRHLAAADTPNRQIILFTDGLPTAHFENGPGTGVDGGGESHLYLLYPPDPLTERATMREALACAREGITINVFLLPAWSQGEDDVAFARRLAERTGGRVLFVGGGDLDRFVLWDYVKQRRTIIG